MGKTTNILDLNNRLTKVEKENVSQNSYTSLKNKPKINNVTLTGNKSLADLGAASSSDLATLSAAIDEINSKITKTSSKVDLDTTYFAGTDWNIVKQGNICVMNMTSIKDIPSGETIIGNIPVGFRPEESFYEFVYITFKDIHLGVGIANNGNIMISNTTGSAITETIYVNHHICYFT